MTRRQALSRLATSSAALAAGIRTLEGQPNHDVNRPATPPMLKGRIHHSVCKWCYDAIPLDDFCAAAKQIGLTSVELLQVPDFPVLKKYGLSCAMVTGVPGNITVGLNQIENHDQIVDYFQSVTPQVASAGFPNIICFSGNRRGMSDETGLANCAIGLKRIMPIVEKYKITVCMELLNSMVNHKDYMGDRTAWGFELVRRVGSERFKILYDIYHMQIMEGNVINTIKANHDLIGHYHTGGVPGRGEIDDTQELNYPAIMRAIVDTGFKGFVAQEFVPKHEDKLASLRQGVQICDV